MTRKIYALLVGIDKYQAPVSPLEGCVNDITAIKEYLEGTVSEENLDILLLLDENATRQAVIEGFRQHLCQAGSEDVAFFYFAGHGSQEEASQEFWHIEPDRKNETILCYDSRPQSNGSSADNKSVFDFKRIRENWDLVDQEIAKLIAEVAKKNPHITIIMDCCNSGSGSRISDTRRAPIDKRQRPIESYIFSKAELEQHSTSRSPESNPSGWNLQQGARYVFLAACRDIEEAQEYTDKDNNQRRGAFSYFLTNTLHNANGSLTYRDLFKRTQALITAKVKTQSPQLEATVQGDIEQPFLGGAIIPRTPYFTVSYHPDDGWVIDGGAIHGIATPVDEQTTTLALFPFDSSPQQLSKLSNALGEAQVTEVKPQRSKIHTDGISELDPNQTYKAVITRLPLPPVSISITGEPAGVELARQALATASLEGKPSLYIREETSTEAEFELVAGNGEYVIVQPVNQRPLVAPIKDYTPETAQQAIARLEHMARWTNIATLSSPAGSRIPSNAVQMEILQNSQEIQSPEIQLEYQQEEGKWKQPTFQIKLRNTSSDDLYCAVLNLTDRYAVKTGLFQPTAGIWLKAGEEALALRGKPIYALVPKELWEQGITEIKDIYKLIVSTAEFDADLLVQDNLDAPRVRAVGGLEGKRKSTLNRLMNLVQTRDFGTAPEDEEFYDDWVTSQVVVTTVRPQNQTSIPQADETVSLGAGVTLQSHPSLQAKVRLATLTQSTRNLGNHILPPILRTDDQNVQPFQFTISRGTEPGLSVLELSEVENLSAVTPEAPLKLSVEQSLGKKEQLLPLAYDGEFFLPLGYANAKADGTTEIVLQRLPEPVSEGKRSLGGSIQIFFQKVLSEKLALEFQYPILAAVEVSSETSINYTEDAEQVKSKVEKADQILLYTHGIIGDTQSLVPSVQTTKIDVNGHFQSLAQLYDLVLTFDYENLNTSMAENARLLKQKLASVGLKENHGKTLHIVAHSMGGLISRWFIEREGGNKVVQHLIMLGTPNGGSPWPTVQAWATTALAVGLNGLSPITWPVPVIGQLLSLVGTGVGAIETVDISLDQMAANSPFLKSLATSPDPNIPYTIVAGNTSLVTAAFQSESESQPPLIMRLMEKLSNQVVELPFFGQPNDIAVTVHSMKSVPGERQFLANVIEVACDHPSYFQSSEGLKGLSEAIAKAL